MMGTCDHPYSSSRGLSAGSIFIKRWIPVFTGMTPAVAEMPPAVAGMPRPQKTRPRSNVIGNKSPRLDRGVPRWPRAKNTLAITLFCYILAACHVREENIGFLQHAPLHHFSAQGKFSVLSKKGLQQGQFLCEQTGEKTTLRLLNPLGQWVATFTVQGKQQHLLTESGETDSLPQGFPTKLPMQNLRFWLQGLPAPTAKTNKLHIKYLSVQKTARGMLPQRLSVEDDKHHYKLQLFIRSWTF